MNAAERDIVINALDQYISNGEELEDIEDPEELVVARALLERMQLQKLKQLGVEI